MSEAEVRFANWQTNDSLKTSGVTSYLNKTLCIRVLLLCPVILLVITSSFRAKLVATILYADEVLTTKSTTKAEVKSYNDYPFV